jgi:hypothetical protein
VNTILEETLKGFMKEVGKEFVKKVAVTTATNGVETYFFYVKKVIEEKFEKEEPKGEEK